MATLCVLRCNGFGPVEKGLAATLRGWFGDDLVIAADERQWRIDTGDYAKIALDDEEVEELGLYPHRAWPWRCGDYALIAARAAYPEYDRFWVIEPDVFFSVDNIAEVFAPLELSDVDLVSAVFRRSDHHWMWTERMERHLEPVFACHFPMLRASARLIDAVATCRRAMSRDPGPDADTHWPNDEAVTASVAYAEQMRTATLAELSEDPTIAEPLVHRADRIWRMAYLRSAGADGRIYHPAYPERRFTEYLERVADQTPHELGPLIDRMEDCLNPEEVFDLISRAQMATDLASSTG